MKTPYVNELQPNQPVTAVFLVQAKDVRQKKSGEPYLSLVLADRTGEIEAKMWDNVPDVLETFDRDDFVRIKGQTQVYQNRQQITIHRLLRIDEREIDAKDFFPASERDPDEMFAELTGIISGFSNPHLKELLEAIFADPEIASRYRLAPAAKNVHHAYLGGLIEHVLSMCTLARVTAGHYRDIDCDLLLAGVILHDLGKIHELSYDRSFTYSDDGQLLGHMIIALRMIDEKLKSIAGFPLRLRTLLEHMILSHHGELEFGSPKVPLFPEALLLHHLDNLDSKMECMRATAANDRHIAGCWTGYNNALERVVLKKSKYLDGSSFASRQQAASAVEPGASQTVHGEAPARPGDPRKPGTPVGQRSGSIFGEKLSQALRKET